MTDHFEPLESGEVISVPADTQILIGHSTFRVGELNEAIKQQLASAIDGWKEEKSQWFSSAGIDCEALRFGSNGWQKGRIRLCLEFSPDEPKLAAESVGNKVVPMMVSTVIESTSLPLVSSDHSVNVSNAVETPVSTISTAISEPVETPSRSATNGSVAAVALGTVAAGVAVMAATQESATATIPSPTVEIPHVTDTVLVPEDEQAHPLNSHEGMEEIAFDFDPASSDKQGTIVADGMMELDLSDLDLDRIDPDYLNFESANIDSAHELNLQEVGRSANSGMLIDEVWNEINQQPNWPGIH